LKVEIVGLLQDEIVKNCGPARAIRDVEDEELMDFFVGMSPWQFPFVVAAGAVAEELFFRVSIQVCYTDINLRTSSSVKF
jgi:hypothetical protein